MTKILFLQDIMFEFMAPMQLSSVLKQDGHKCKLIIIPEEKNYLKKIKIYSPDFIAFSTMTGPHHWVLDTVEKLKQEFSIPIILGGPHPTFFPDIIRDKNVDMICRGEGEKAIVELANNPEKTEIKNLWIKRGNKFIRIHLII
jgi:radical SAM superfamily enzyme YgiQ (UPF0313 family)